MSNGTLEAIITLEVGPRILSFTRDGSENPFKIYQEQSGKSHESEWMIRGGHRLWIAPEAVPMSYFPDNDAVDFALLQDGGVRLRPKAEQVHGIQKEWDIHFDPKNPARMHITHRVMNVGSRPLMMALWALTVMAPGGFAVVPQPPLGTHPEDLLPNRNLILWPYTDLTDPRWHLGRQFHTLKQDASRGATKMGWNHSVGWASYCLNQQCFTKYFTREGDLYPDLGCNLELFANEDMLELESLGTLGALQPGKSKSHLEIWTLEPLPSELNFRDEKGLSSFFSNRSPS